MGQQSLGAKDGAGIFQNPLVTSLAQTDAVAKLLFEKGLVTQDELLQKIKAERATYQAMFQKSRE